MAEITIRGKRGEGKFVIVDDSLFEELNKTSWYLDRYGYAVTIPQKEERGNGTRLMHRIIIKAPKGKIVDHINGNRLDNRLENLRIITTKENTYNVQKSKLTTATSQYKGVSFIKENSIHPWRAQIRHERKQYYLGFYKTEVEAALAYNKAAKEKFGEYAKLNEVCFR